MRFKTSVRKENYFYSDTLLYISIYLNVDPQ